MPQNLRHKRGHVANAGHQTYDHRPAEIRAMKRRWLVNDRADTFRFDDTPHEEHDSSNGSNDRLQSEKMATDQMSVNKNNVPKPYARTFGGWGTKSQAAR